jgi:hypothetical protein
MNTEISAGHLACRHRDARRRLGRRVPPLSFTLENVVMC